ncbi:hypothetical protein KP509_09G004000 [Ceratopteris richardii]|uniref:WAP domain-containing protein n=1 Tax=Ceratopteris richardii TaxID=49495 RepID=A0A8T2U4Q7_CERRI|nr:hypothetical protein KP509_09G004000 [Ceratopteris richardii]
MAAITGALLKFCANAALLCSLVVIGMVHSSSHPWNGSSCILPSDNISSHPCVPLGCVTHNKEEKLYVDCRNNDFTCEKLCVPFTNECCYSVRND